MQWDYARTHQMPRHQFLIRILKFQARSAVFPDTENLVSDIVDPGPDFEELPDFVEAHSGIEDRSSGQ